MNEEIIIKAGEIIEKNTGIATYCTLSLLDSRGYPTTSTITASKADSINWITFCTGISSNKTNRIRNNNRASVCLNDKD